VIEANFILPTVSFIAGLKKSPGGTSEKMWVKISLGREGNIQWILQNVTLD
jgi:hypothetical protein